ncbi:MAG TPA: histidine phosphatase family protein [Beutenbergiaceae bacterium]|nr:histidine phosphatase family protein [Beutenbergiaceae bacterium]
MARTLVHLVRHGEVDNPNSILYGRLAGYHLSDLGRSMAERLATDFTRRRAHVTHIVASPLERAQETAMPIAEAFNLPLHTDERVIEAESKLQGQPISAQPALLLKPANLRWLFNPFTPSWGESYRDQVQRMIQAIKDTRAQAHGGEAVIVSHQSPIWSTRLFLEGRPFVHDPRHRQCTLASVTTLIFHDSTLVGLGYREPAAELLTHAKTIT